ncbi:unnamed protein product [Somion occarium]|uniref:Uncharacterized protein n=1 Tax=Somion occarium TaxID=3059160 RepID=A0ABP1DW92_9APHY
MTEQHSNPTSRDGSLVFRRIFSPPILLVHPKGSLKRYIHRCGPSLRGLATILKRSSSVSTYSCPPILSTCDLQRNIEGCHCDIRNMDGPEYNHHHKITYVLDVAISFALGFRRRCLSSVFSH